MLWIVPPVGLALIWTCKKEWKNALKCALSVIFVIWMLLWVSLLLSPTDNTANDNSASEEETIAYDETNSGNSKETTENEAEISKTETSKVTDTTAKDTTKPATTQKPTTTTKPTTTKVPTTVDPESKITVYITETGKRYHYENPCGNGTYYATTLSKAKSLGLTPCNKCVIH